MDETKPATTVISLFVFCGIIGAFIQGGAIGRLVKMFGEPKLIALSLVLTGISLALLPFIKGDGQLKWLAVLHFADWPWIKMLLALALLAIGSSLTRPPVFGLLSNLAPANEQGATIGVAQSAGALARIVGPIFAATLYLQVPMLPYVICGAISILAGVLAIQRLGKGLAMAGEQNSRSGGLIASHRLLRQSAAVPFTQTEIYCWSGGGPEGWPSSPGGGPPLSPATDLLLGPGPCAGAVP